jgi:serine/threonine protein kinase
MSSPTRTEAPGSSIRSRGAVTPIPPSAEDALSGPAPSTDDTPTTISRNNPPPVPVPLDDSGAGVRGRHLAHFELLEPIGVGGMAAVLRARDTQLDRFVALKILPPEMATDPENVRRFHQEARSAAKLDHENIARVFYCGEDQRLHFIAFEFVEGENLRVLLERRGRLPVGEAVHYMLQVAAGLAHATRRGVVHRDIKPSNIIITPTGRAKLVDMGLARSLEKHADEDLTQSGVTLGTFDYISPEQALEPRDADVRSDIYSLGCTFYHTLTGRPPFPEGTASQKLLHHQRVRPADPRDIVPDTPVGVVQILDRMMAKNPRDRFQSAEELVHQLLLLARQLGTTVDSTEGVLTVEASIPNPPTSRPLLWAALAAVAVIVVVLVLDQPSSHPTDPPRRAETPIHPEDEKPAPKTPAAPVKPPEQPPVVGPLDGTAKFATYTAPEVPTLQHLRDWLAENATAPRIELRLAGKLDVSGSGSGMNDLRGLLLAAREHIIIRARDERDPPTIRLTYLALGGNPGALVALKIQAPKSHIEGIRFVLDATEADLEMQALLFGEGNHEVSRCEFIQARASLRPETRRVASILAEGKDGNLTVKDCVFLGFGKLTNPGNGGAYTLSQPRTGGRDAIVRRGAIKVGVENCFFGPHAAAFRLEGGGARDSTVAVQNCSILLPAGRSAAFDVPDGGVGRIDMAHSVVCRLPGEGDGETSLIQQAGDRLADVAYHGDDNAYYDLDAFWVTDDNWKKARWTDFRARMAEGSNKDENSRVLLSWPWQLDAAGQLAALEELKLGEAASIDVKSPLLRQKRSSTHLVGTPAILGRVWHSTPLPVLDPLSSAPRTLVVEAEGGDVPNGVFDSLSAAVAAARNRDTILIRHQGVFKIDTVQVNKKGVAELTVRAARRYKPILTLDDSSEAVATLFRVHYCKLSLEGLEFLLQSEESKVKARTVVTLFGDGECILRDCVATLQKADSVTTNLALATLVESSMVMKPDMPTARTRDQGPRLSLERCFVRGEGDLVWTRATRPFALEVKQSLVAVSGALLDLDAAPDSQAPPTTQKVKLDLSRTTAYLKASLVRIKAAKEVTGLVPVECKANGCLFVPATPGNALIRLDAPEGEENSLRDRFDWAGNGNSYGDYAGQFNDAAEMMPGTGMKWKMPGEDSKFGVKPAEPSPAGTRFSAMKPNQFTWADVSSDTGADAAKLPVPASR